MHNNHTEEFYQTSLSHASRAPSQVRKMKCKPDYCLFSRSDVFLNTCMIFFQVQHVSPHQLYPSWNFLLDHGWSLLSTFMAKFWW